MNLKYHVFVFTIVHLLRSGNLRSLTKGPYKTTVLSVRECAKTARPRLKPEYGPVDTWVAELYNTSTRTNLVRGNITLQHHNTRITMKTEGFMWKDGIWKRFFVADIDCDSPFMKLIGMFSNLSFDSKTCSFPKGVYTFLGLDADKLDHYLSNEQTYGRVLRKHQMLTKYNTLICVVFEQVVEPLKKNS